MKPILFIVLFSVFIHAELLAYQDGSRIAWDYSSGKFVTNGVYSRVKRLASGELALVYSDGPSVFIRKSSTNGNTWSNQVLVSSFNGYNYTNADMIQLSNGWLLYAWNGRPVQEGGSLPFIIKTKLSKDNGATWINEQLMYTADVVGGNGCWEPSLLQLPSGEIQLFFANENPFRNNNDQNITMIRSYDSGGTWTTPITTSYRTGGRDGMPVPVYLKNSTIAYAIEDPGYNGTFKPVVISSTLQNNWNNGAVAGNSPNRWGALRSDYALPASTYAGAPYLIQMPNGETVLSCQSEQGRSPGNSNMQVYIGDENAKNFSRQNTPFPYLPASGSALWNALLALDENTVMATSSVNTGGNGPNGIWIITGKVIPPIKAYIGNITIDGVLNNTEWNAPYSAFIGSYSNSNATVKTSYDADNFYVSMNVKDEHLWNNATASWDKDGIELYLDPQNKNCTGVCNGLYKVLVNISSETYFQTCNSQNVWDAWAPTGVRYKVKTSGTVNNNTDTDQGYVVEVAIPWNQIGGKPAVNAGWGIHVKLHDNRDGGTATITHEELSGANANNASTWLRIDLANTANGHGLTGNYYTGMDFTKEVLNRIDPVIDFNWGTGSPAGAVTPDTFSVRWTGYITPEFTEVYTFFLNSDNGRRLWIGDSLVIDKWVDDWGTEYSGKIQLTANKKYPIRIDYFEDGGGADITLSWSSNSRPKERIPTEHLEAADSGTRFPYYKVLQIPGTIQAEDFDLGNNGVTYATTDLTNAGGQYRSEVGVGIESCSDAGKGYDVGWIQNGEKLQYSVNVLETGLYTCRFRVASGGTGGAIVVKSGNTVSGTATVSNTGGWQNWQTVTGNISLTKGKQIIELQFSGTGASLFNLNSITVVPAAIITTSGATSFCPGGSVVLQANTGTGRTYTWLNANTVINGASASGYTATAAGSYRVVVSLAGYADTSAATVVTVYSNPAAVITAANGLSFCQGSSTMLNASVGNGFTYQWNNAAGSIAGATGISYPATLANTYSVKITNANNCSTVSSTVTTSVDAPPSVSNTGPNQYITTSATTLAANAPSTGSGVWSVKKGTASFSNAASAGSGVSGITRDTTVLSWTISNGSCASSVSTVTIYKGTAPAAQIIAGPVSVVSNQSGLVYAVRAVKGSVFHWTAPAGALIESANADSTRIIIQFGSSAGRISVQESNAFGSITDKLDVNIATTTGIQPETTGAFYELKPNPFDAYTSLFIRTTDTVPLDYLILDLSGKICAAQTGLYTNTELRFGDELPPGVYIMQVTYLTERILIKVVKR